MASKTAEVKSQLKSKRYERGSFIGKGQIGQFYELLDTDTEVQAVYAAKIVPQSQLVTSLRKQRLTNEIEIHRSLAHPHIVGFHDFFENKNYVYILLHLCGKL